MRVALCSKEGLIGDALASLLNHKGGFSVVGRSSDIRDCVSSAKENGAEVILIHADTLDRSDVGFLSGARTYGDFKTILISPEPKPKNLSEFEFDHEITYANDSSELFEGLSRYREEGRGRGRYVREGRRRYGGLDLTKREYEVAQLVAQGMSNRTIAQTAGLQEQSVKNLVSVIMRKMKCENRVQVALKLTGSTPANIG
jgi:DNA-binding NarL/FixJ family response regulator